MPGSDASNDEKLRLYVLVALGLVALAAFSIILSSGARSASIQARCGSLVFQSDRYNCLLSAAISTRNASMCGSLQGSYADECYMGIAQNTSNSALCSSIKYSNLSNQCFYSIANSTMNPETCKGISSGLETYCIYHIATETNSTATCSLLGTRQEQLYCNSTIYFNAALDGKDPALCARIYTNNYTNATYAIMQNSTLGQHEGLVFNVTQVVEDAIFFNKTLGARDLCYTSIAFEDGNNASCIYIQDPNLEATCQSDAPAHTNSTNSSLNYTQLLELCSATPGNNTQCVYGAMTIHAAETGNVSICKSIPSAYAYSCFYDLASRYNNAKYCSFITNATLSSTCIGNIEGLYPNNTNSSD